MSRASRAGRAGRAQTHEPAHVSAASWASTAWRVQQGKYGKASTARRVRHGQCAEVPGRGFVRLLWWCQWPTLFCTHVRRRGGWRPPDRPRHTLGWGLALTSPGQDPCADTEPRGVPGARSPARTGKEPPEGTVTAPAAPAAVAPAAPAALTWTTPGGATCQRDADGSLHVLRNGLAGRPGRARTQPVRLPRTTHSQGLLPDIPPPDPWLTLPPGRCREHPAAPSGSSSTPSDRAPSSASFHLPTFPGAGPRPCPHPLVTPLRT